MFSRGGNTVRRLVEKVAVRQRDTLTSGQWKALKEDWEGQATSSRGRSAVIDNSDFTVAKRERAFTVRFHPRALERLIPGRRKPEPLAIPRTLTKPVRAGDFLIGGPQTAFLVGPERFQSSEQLLHAGVVISEAGGKFLRLTSLNRGGYQRNLLDERELKILSHAARRFNLNLVGEVRSVEELPLLLHHCDVLEVPAACLNDEELLMHLGECEVAVILHRGISNSLSELAVAIEMVERGRRARIVLAEDGQLANGEEENPLFDLCGLVTLTRQFAHPVLVNCAPIARDWTYLGAVAAAAVSVGAAGVLFEVEGDFLSEAGGKGEALFGAEFHATSRRVEALRYTAQAAALLSAR